MQTEILNVKEQKLYDRLKCQFVWSYHHKNQTKEKNKKSKKTLLVKTILLILGGLFFITPSYVYTKKIKEIEKEIAGREKSFIEEKARSLSNAVVYKKNLEEQFGFSPTAKKIRLGDIINSECNEYAFLDSIEIEIKDKEEPSFIYPIENWHISSRFGRRKIKVMGGFHKGFHTGIDLTKLRGNTDGSDVYAVADGIVKEIVRNYKKNKGFGRYVLIDHPNYENDAMKIETIYAHLSKILAEVGDTVKAGDVIGKVGTTGFSSGSHLHFEVQIDGKPEDPRIFLEENREKFLQKSREEKMNMHKLKVIEYLAS